MDASTESSTEVKTEEENNPINPIKVFGNHTIFTEIPEAFKELIKAARSSYDLQNDNLSAYGFNDYVNACGFADYEFSADLKDIIRLYLHFGRETLGFSNISEYNMKQLRHFVQKYALTSDDFPVDNEVSFRQVTAHNPIILAHVLQEYASNIYGSLNGLPRSLAFPCGLKLIPSSAEWKPLQILWKMWKVSFPESVVHHEVGGDYMTIAYLFENSYELEDIMSDLSIHPPSASEVSYKIFRILSIHKRDTLPRDFEDVFSIYAKDILEFYCEYSTKFRIERLICDECHIGPLEVSMRVKSILNDRKTDGMIIDPIYKAVRTDKVLTSPPKLRLSKKEFKESILMTVKRVESSDDGFNASEFKVLSGQLNDFEQAIKSYEFMVNSGDLEVGTKIDSTINRLRNLRDKTMSSLKRMQGRADDARAAKRQKLLHANLPGSSGQQEVSQNLPENPKFSGDHGHLKRNRSNDFKDMTNEALKCTKNQYQCGEKYKSKADFSHLPSVLEVISQQEGILHEQRKFRIYSPAYSKGALYWNVEKRKLFWEFDRHTSLPSCLAASESATEQMSKNMVLDLRSIRQRIRDEVRKYFTQNPVKYCGVFDSSFQELPITEQFLNSLTKPKTGVSPTITRLTPTQENLAKMLKQCAKMAINLCTRNTDMFGNRLDDLIIDFLESGQDIWLYDSSITINKLWKRVSETLGTDLVKIERVSEKNSGKIAKLKFQDPRLCKPEISNHSSAELMAENSSNRDSQQSEAPLKNTFEDMSLANMFWKDLEEIGLDSMLSGTIAMKSDGCPSKSGLKRSLVQWLIINGMSKGVEAFQNVFLLISSSRLLRPQLEFFIESGAFTEWVGNSLEKKTVIVKPETSKLAPLFPIKPCFPIKKVQSEIITENEALMQCAEYSVARKVGPKTLGQVSDVIPSPVTLSPIKSHVPIVKFPTPTKLDSGGNLLTYEPLTIRLKAPLDQNSHPRSILRRIWKRDMDQSLTSGTLPHREKAEKGGPNELCLDFNDAQPLVALENATRDILSNICGSEETKLPSFHETFDRIVGLNNGKTSNYFESTVPHSGDCPLQIVMDRYLPQLSFSQGAKSAEKTKQIRKVIQARMADSRKQPEPIPKV